MKESGVAQLPIIDDQGQVVDLKTLAQLTSKKRHDNWVFLLAGDNSSSELDFRKAAELGNMDAIKYVKEYLK